MTIREKQTNWKSGSGKNLLEVKESSEKAWLASSASFLSPEELEDLAEAAVQAAQALRLIAETKSAETA